MNDITYAGRHALVSSVSRHRHDSWEFVYCTQGTGLFEFEDDVLHYTRGDVVIVPPSTPPGSTTGAISPAGRPFSSSTPG